LLHFDAFFGRFQYLKSKVFYQTKSKKVKKMETKTKELRPANTFGVQFIVRQDKLRDGKVPVYARITVNVEIPLKLTT